MDPMQFVPILVVGFAASLGLTPISRQIAMRLGVPLNGFATRNAR